MKGAASALFIGIPPMVAGKIDGLPTLGESRATG
jgi:hypothetical protein